MLAERVADAGLAEHRSACRIRVVELRRCVLSLRCRRVSGLAGENGDIVGIKRMPRFGGGWDAVVICGTRLLRSLRGLRVLGECNDSEKDDEKQ